MKNKHYRSHATFNKEHRILKAQKIIKIIESDRSLKGLNILDIGTGSGVIAACLAEKTDSSGTVTGIDVCDERIIKEGYTFIQVNDSYLPFDDACFDVVVSNHVIEHVGDQPNQLVHLQEIHRVVRDNGIVYLTAPNRWSIIEPHYKLPFLSWIPRFFANHYVKLTRNVKVYDCFPPGPLDLRSIMRNSGFMWKSVTGEALKIMVDVENKQGIYRFIKKIPTPIINSLSMLSPTMVFLIKKN